MKIISRLFLIFLLTLFVSSALAPVVYAQEGDGTTGPEVKGFVPLSPIPGLTAKPDGAALDTVSLTTFLNNLYKYLVGLAAIIAIIQIIRGGLEWSTQDSVSKHTSGKEHIQQALLGLLLVLSPVLVFSIINPSILNLNISLQNLNAGTPFSGGPPPGVKDEETGCIVVGVEGALQVATCPSEETGAEWLAAHCSGSEVRSKTECSGKTSKSNCATTKVTCEYKTKELTFVNVGNTGTFIDDYKLQAFGSDSATHIEGFQAVCSSAYGQLCTENLYGAFIKINPENYCPYTSELRNEQSGKCYQEEVYCFSREDASEANSLWANIKSKLLTIEISLIPTLIWKLFSDENVDYICDPDVQFISTPLP